MAATIRKYVMSDNEINTQIDEFLYLFRRRFGDNGGKC